MRAQNQLLKRGTLSGAHPAKVCGFTTPFIEKTQTGPRLAPLFFQGVFYDKEKNTGPESCPSRDVSSGIVP